MLIGEAGKEANLTKKAIEYYAEQGLISPAAMENGYRDFSLGDVERLKKISVFRRLGLSARDIRAALADETGVALHEIAIRKGLGAQGERAKIAALGKLCAGARCSEISAELEAVERGATVAERLMDAFPGLYGRLICLYFARFLNEPIASAEQLRAYGEAMAFLDNLPALDFPADLRFFLDGFAPFYSPEAMSAVLEGVGRAAGNPEAFLSENREELEQYLEFKQSDEYKSSPLGKIQALLAEFSSSSGYCSVFIPAMEKLSRPYAEYRRQMQALGEKLSSALPNAR
jgi:DNA-binding transcriptional MerR regulator